jgi:membrane protein DedA with SNARE-associated domain
VPIFENMGATEDAASRRPARSGGSEPYCARGSKPPVDSAPVHGITEAVTSFIGDYGLYAVFVLSFVDAILPAASEVVMVYGGALAAGAFPGSDVSLFGITFGATWEAYLAVAIAGTIGYVLGSILGWGIGFYGGRALLTRHGRLLHVTPEKLERAERWFDRYDDAAVAIGRVLPLIRSFISIPAGVVEMPLGRYTAFTTLGTIPWYFGLAGAGVAVGASWERFHENFRYADYVVLAILVAGAVFLLARAARKRARRRGIERSA